MKKQNKLSKKTEQVSKKVGYLLGGKMIFYKNFKFTFIKYMGEISIPNLQGEKKLELKNKIVFKLKEMQKYLEELETLLPTEEEYKHNLTIRRACEKTMELAIGTVIDILYMINSEERFDFSATDDLISTLKEKSIISPKLSLKLKDLKGFRNILIHEQAYDIMKNDTNDFFEFKKEIEKYLKKK